MGDNIVFMFTLHLAETKETKFWGMSFEFSLTETLCHFKKRQKIKADRSLQRYQNIICNII
ncbi:unnamed protein product [Brassica oleracea]